MSFGVDLKHKALTVTVTGVIVLVGAFYLMAGTARTGQGEGPLRAPPAGEVTVRGRMVCLPHRDERGPQTLECAFGLATPDGTYFALRDTDPEYRNVSGVPMDVPVEVAGVFTPGRNSKYKDIGVIEVRTLTRYAPDGGSDD